MTQGAQRLFVSVDLPSTIKAELKALQQPAEYIRWSNPDQLHVTVHFLGATPEEKIREVKKIIKAVAEDIPPFQIKLSGVSVEKNVMIWVNIKDETGSLAAAHFKIKKDLLSGGLGEKRGRQNFNPHVLLGKYKGEILSEDDFVVTRIKRTLKITPFDVNMLSLYKSDLKPAGTVHTVLQQFPLAGYEPGEPELAVDDKTASYT